MCRQKCLKQKITYAHCLPASIKLTHIVPPSNSQCIQMSRRKQRRNSAKEQQLSRREDQLWTPVGNWRKTVTICQLHNLRFTGVAGTTAAGAVAAAARLSARAAVDCKFAASISVLACGLDVSTPGEDGPELSSTVGNNWVALDSSEMLLGDATRE